MAHTIPTASVPAAERKKAKTWQRLLPFLITAACFAYLYSRLSRAAAAEGSSLVSYLLKSFENVSWPRWLALMIPYCFLYLVFDSLVVWSVINWFNTKIRYTDILPIRASAYILSLVNEQVSKGAIALYLNRRDGVPGWEIGSSMLFLMFCEYYSLILWGAIGVMLRWGSLQASLSYHPLDGPGLRLFSSCFFISSSAVKSARESLCANDQFSARSGCAKVWQYGAVILMRAPLVIAGVVVYTLALRLFGVSVGFGEMLGYLPVIFFGAAMPGPMHSVAILFWVLLFPDRPGQMTAFGFVMHNFFIFFNAGVGLLFLRRATREMFG